MPLKFETCTVDLASHQVTCEDGEKLDLTPLEHRLLACLWARVDQIVTSEELMQEVWEWKPGRATRTLELKQQLPIRWVALHLRNKVERNPTRPRHVITCKGVGLRLERVTEQHGGDGPLPVHPPPVPIPPTPSPTWVPRPEEELEAQTRLGPGVPLVAAGPKGIGKSVFIESLLTAHMRSDDRVVRIKLDSPHRIQTRETDRFLFDIALELGEQLDLDDERATAVWSRAATSSRGLTRFLREVALPAVPGRLFLVIDPADALTQRGPVPNELFALLRLWLDDTMRAPMDRLRVLMAVSTDPVLLTDEYSISPFNLAPPVRLLDFGPEQATQLLHQYGLAPTEQERALALHFTGGNPALLVLLGKEAATRGLTVSGLIQRPLDERSLFYLHCEERLSMLRANPTLAAALHAILNRTEAPVDMVSADRLVWAGLARRVERTYTVHNALYARFFQERL